jgi:hypothetical protein
MKKTCLILLAAVSLTTLASVPAMAQYGPPPGAQGWSVGDRIRWTEDRIARGRDDGSLDPREYTRVWDELSDIKHEDQRIKAYEGGHIDPGARAELLARLDRLNDRIHWLRAHNERRPW